MEDLDNDDEDEDDGEGDDGGDDEEGEEDGNGRIRTEGGRYIIRYNEYGMEDSRFPVDERDLPPL